MAKEFAKAFYKSKAWQRCRAAYGASVGWLCEDCLKDGRYTPGRIVHHRETLTPENINDPDIALGWDNLKLVCEDCHGREHRREQTMRYRFDDSGEVAPPV